eukprot:CAMPEP_0198492286 /NCGR_PEP_ID=MMETSP1462-20131121/3346_1 /TAXON_ID=1333877 /ORGANISM="Brandtodinium nutriculum, Strain RCC3387" /LENGTH=38 /DNA_ID= /DNA_START= /DNA_END= /DNA_ORIENTATION=
MSSMAPKISFAQPSEAGASALMPGGSKHTTAASSCMGN